MNFHSTPARQLLIVLILFLGSCGKSDEPYTAINKVALTNFIDSQEVDPTLSCQDSSIVENMCGIIYTGLHEYLETSLDKLPYKETSKKYFYANQNNEEIILELVGKAQHVESFTGKFYNCGNQTNYTKTCRENLVYSIYLCDNTSSFVLRVELTLRVGFFDVENFDSSYKDILNISKSTNGRHYHNQFTIDVNERNYPQNINEQPHHEIKFDKLTLLNKEYSNVSTDTLLYYFGPDPLYKYYFNYEIGIIGFEDEKENIWELQRIE